MDIRKYIETTDLTLKQIVEATGKSIFEVRKEWVTYSREFRKKRKSFSYARSKTGDLNPMKGKFGNEHHNFIGEVSDGRGYLMVLKPDWYTGRKGSKHVFVHQVVVCKEMNLPEMPRGWIVHHCDEDKTNNSFDNLVLMTMKDHIKLHIMLEGATTISKESTLKWVEAHGTPFKV